MTLDQHRQRIDYYRAYTIVPIDDQFRVSMGRNGYLDFPTVEAAKGMIDIWWMR